MIVVGGTYDEFCRYPYSRELRGSGLRAAAALTSSGEKIELCSTVDDETRESALAITNGYGLTATWKRRTEPVRFSYFTPLSAPLIDGRLATCDSAIDVDAEVVLAFGLIETPAPHVRARRLVFDPQQPRDLLALPKKQISADELVVVANAAETRALGKSADLFQAARQMLGETGAVSIVTKRGARGALVTTKDAQEEIGPHPTDRVWPIGSGDVFAAGFAYAWGVKSLAPVDAARIGSAAAASWCGSQVLPIPTSVLEGESQTPELPPRAGRVYLAAPFFTVSQMWLLELVKESLEQNGAEVFSPLHHVGRGDQEVAAADLAGLDQCSAVLGLLDGSDPGTTFEVGWARKNDLPVIAYAENVDQEALKMLAGSGVEFQRDLSTAVYRAVWASMRSGSTE